MQQIVFLTLFLGLTTGWQSVYIQADDGIKAVRIELGGKSLGTIEHPPWAARIDFGSEIVPQELVAIGLDADGTEVGRASQVVNVPHPVAELEIVLSRVGLSELDAQLVGNHRTHAAPRSAKVWLDGRRVRVSRDFRAELPLLNSSQSHVLSAEMRFDDGVTARRETGLQGGFADSTSSQLTPVVLTVDPKTSDDAIAGCLSLDAAPLHVNGIEKTGALVIVVKDPDASDAIDRLHNALPQLPGWFRVSDRWWVDRDSFRLRHELKLANDTSVRVLWPIANEYAAGGKPTYDLFQPTNEVSGRNVGMAWLLIQHWADPPDLSHARRFSDAVAVAGVSALAQDRRRAVVLLLGNAPDHSTHSPAVVRRYLDRVGVPLFVWSVDGPRPDLADSWGAVENISKPAGISDAVAKLNESLAAQRIAWVAADAISSLRIRTDDRCGVEPLAHASAPPPAPNP